MGAGASGGTQPKLLVLVDAYLRHESALRASIRAEYQVADIRLLGVLELADLVEWLPAGAALWRSTGGPLALTISEDTLRWVDYRLKVLAWQQTEDAKHKRNAPKPPEKVPYAGEVAAEEAHASRQAAARRRRTANA